MGIIGYALVLMILWKIFASYSDKLAGELSDLFRTYSKFEQDVKKVMGQLSNDSPLKKELSSYLDRVKYSRDKLSKLIGETERVFDSLADTIEKEKTQEQISK